MYIHNTAGTKVKYTNESQNIFTKIIIIIIIIIINRSIIISLADDLFTGWSEEYSVFILCSKGPSHVTQRRIRINYTGIAQILKRHQVPTLTKPVQPPATEGKSGEVLIDDVEELLCACHAKRDVSHFKVFHVVRAVHVIVDLPSPRRTESLNSKELSFFHLNGFTA